MSHSNAFDHVTEVCDFRSYLNENTFEGYDDHGSQEFTPKAVLQKYFQSQRKRLQRLLSVTLTQEDNQRVNADTVLVDYVAVYSTLITIGYPQFLWHFISWGLCDSKLPLESEPRYFPSLTDGTSLLNLFKEAQWRFCPFEFRKQDSDYYVSRRHILPVCTKKEIRRRPPATVYKVTLHENCDPFAVGGQSAPASSPRPPHTYIFKQFHGAHATEAYRKELKAFLHLSQTARSELGKSIIGFHGSFIQGESRTIILEYADHGTLEDFLRNTEAPQEAKRIMLLWEGLFVLLAAVHTIHNIPPSGDHATDTDRRHSVLRGFHQDIKPANILVISAPNVSEHDFEFRLADLGTTHFALIDAHAENDRAAADVGGTKEYGAPECYRFGLLIEQPSRVQQGVDIWSLGCVFSEFAVWMACGLARLNMYREERGTQTEELRLVDPRCFHNGEGGVLPCVRTFHGHVISSKRNSDHVTEEVLTSMVDEMLGPDHESRPSTKLLTRKAETIVHRAREKIETKQLGSPFNHRSESARLSPRKERHPSQLDQRSTETTLPHRQVPSISLPALRLHTRQQGVPPSSSPIPSDEEDSSDLLNNQSGSETPITSPASSRRKLRGRSRDSFHQTVFEAGEQQPEPAYQALRGLAINDHALVPTPLTPSSIRRPAGLFAPTTGDARDPSPTAPVFDEACSNNGSGSRMQGGMFEPPRPVVQNPKKTVVHKPELVMSSLQNHYASRKQGETTARLPDEHVLNPLQAPKRDFVFLIDDSGTMRNQRDAVCDAVKCLGWLLKRFDDNGLDMYFMRDPNKYSARAKSSSDLREPLLKCMVDARGTSDGGNRLGTLLNDYTNAYRAAKALPAASSGRRSFLSRAKPITYTVRPLMIYVITDAAWEPGSEPDELIEVAANALDAEGAPMNQLGIQFISVKAQSENLAKLEQLDSGLGLHRDMVDTEPIGGNVYKMLMGPLSRMWDDDAGPRT